MAEDPIGVTRLLIKWREGDAEALEELTPIVYGELRRLARHYMRAERQDHVLQTTALVHEAYLKLVGLDLSWRGRVHFLAVAARLMRRVLVDYARERDAAKRGGGAQPVTLEEARLIAGPAPDVVALDEALDSLARIDERKGRVVELRFFGGLTIEETADLLDISHATVERDMKMAKAWLSRELKGGESVSTSP